jgi:hypothetical protein
MSVIIQGDQLRTLVMGNAIPRASATIPQTTSYAIFNVTGGKVLITSIVGEVTVVIGSTAVSFNLTYTPTGGSAADLCAATVCTSDAVGTIYSLTSTVATDLLNVQSVSYIGGTPVAASEVPNVTFAPILWRPIVVRPGAVNFKAGASTTGEVKWIMTYVELENGAAVAAA